jgi:hypothetical protein
MAGLSGDGHGCPEARQRGAKQWQCRRHRDGAFQLGGKISRYEATLISKQPAPGLRDPIPSTAGMQVALSPEWPLSDTIDRKEILMVVDPRTPYSPDDPGSPTPGPNAPQPTPAPSPPMPGPGTPPAPGEPMPPRPGDPIPRDEGSLVDPWRIEPRPDVVQPERSPTVTKKGRSRRKKAAKTDRTMKFTRASQPPPTPGTPPTMPPEPPAPPTWGEGRRPSATVPDQEPG